MCIFIFCFRALLFFKALFLRYFMQAISAQILARLSSHPESRVRKQLKGLLMSSAKLSPWAIVYPLLVDMNGSDEVLSEELEDLRDCLVNSDFDPLLTLLCAL